MRAIDTNVIVRFLVGDEKRQANRARTAIAAGDIHIGMTVLLETEWVLRSGYKFSPDRIAAALRHLAGLPGVSIEKPAVVALALDWLDAGMDFADALHLAGSEGCDTFLTFDRTLAKLAAGRSAMAVQQP